jgi:hypothetical protein
MNRTHALANRLGLAITAASVALGAFASFGAQPARADEGQRLTNFEIQDLMSSYNSSESTGTGTYSKTLTFTLSTTQPSVEGEKWFVADSFSFGVEREMK